MSEHQVCHWCSAAASSITDNGRGQLCVQAPHPSIIPQAPGGRMEEVYLFCPAPNPSHHPVIQSCNILPPSPTAVPDPPAPTPSAWIPTTGQTQMGWPPVACVLLLSASNILQGWRHTHTHKDNAFHSVSHSPWCEPNLCHVTWMWACHTQSLLHSN